MEIRQAILKAADSIEKYPNLFDFDSTKDPSHDCGTPGCAIGWIAHHLNIQEWTDTGTVYSHLSITNDYGHSFYKRMHSLAYGWTANADACANVLRKYADKYHPEHTGIPENIKQIFTGERTVEMEKA